MTAPVLGILGQSAPGAASNSDIYTVPASRRTVVSTLAICNTGAATTVRVFARIAGAAAAVGNAIAYDLPVGANSHTALTEGITLAATDKLTVQSNAGGVTFTAFGEETDVPAS